MLVALVSGVGRARLSSPVPRPGAAANAGCGAARAVPRRAVPRRGASPALPLRWGRGLVARLSVFAQRHQKLPAKKEQAAGSVVLCFATFAAGEHPLVPAVALLGPRAASCLPGQGTRARFVGPSL